MVGAIGVSAGGSLVARASSRYEETLYSPQDAADSLSAKLGFSMLIYPAYLDKGANRSITPELKINENHPQVFLFATADDTQGTSTLEMDGALRADTVPL